MPAYAVPNLLFAVLCLFTISISSRVPADDDLPAIALIIDDLGSQRDPGSRAVNLPGPVACSFLPFGTYTRELAQQAHSDGKEVMLHLPMQAAGPFQQARESGVLTVDMTNRQYRETFQRNLAAVPHVSGFNNHMGSLLTRHPGNMAWLMRIARETGKLFFVDSRTTTATVARQLANEYGIPNSERNVFLDNLAQPESIRMQFQRLVRIARREGTALAIGHPYSATLDVLTEELQHMDRTGVRLVSVAELIELQQDRKQAWPRYSSR